MLSEIAEGIVGCEWQEYNLREVGPILVLEDEDTIEALEAYKIIQENKNIPQVLPEFALRIEVGEAEICRIIWVCSDSLGVTVYYSKGKFGQEFEQWLEEYLIN